MSDYSATKARVLQWFGIILIVGLFAGAYWYFSVRASTLNASKNEMRLALSIISPVSAYEKSSEPVA